MTNCGEELNLSSPGLIVQHTPRYAVVESAYRIFDHSPTGAESDKFAQDEIALLVQYAVHIVIRNFQPDRQTSISENENSQPESAIQPHNHASINGSAGNRVCAASFDLP